MKKKCYMIDPDGGVYTFAEYEKICDEMGCLPAYPEDWEIKYCTEDEIHNHAMKVHRDFIEDQRERFGSF